MKWRMIRAVSCERNFYAIAYRTLKIFKDAKPIELEDINTDVWTGWDAQQPVLTLTNNGWSYSVVPEFIALVENMLVSPPILKISCAFYTMDESLIPIVWIRYQHCKAEKILIQNLWPDYLARLLFGGWEDHVSRLSSLAIYKPRYEFRRRQSFSSHVGLSRNSKRLFTDNEF